MLKFRFFSLIIIILGATLFYFIYYSYEGPSVQDGKKTNQLISKNKDAETVIAPNKDSKFFEYSKKSENPKLSRKIDIDPAERSEIDQKIIDAIGRLDEGDTLGGIADLKKIAMENPENQTVLEELGLFYMDQEQWDLAYPQLEKLMNLNPNNSIAINELAHLIEERDSSIKAISFLKQQREKYPESIAVMSTLADFLAKDEKYDQALPIMEEIIQKTGGSIYEFETIANVYADQGMHDKAIEYLMTAKAKILEKLDSKGENIKLNDKDEDKEDPDDDEYKMEYNRTTLKIASIYIEVGKCDQADEELRKILPLPFEMSSVLIVNEEFEKKCRK